MLEVDHSSADITKALIIGYVWPETNASAAGVRDWGLVGAFLRAGWKLSYASPAKENEFTQRLRERGLEACSIAANDPAFDAFLDKLRPDVVVFDRFVIEEQFGWRVEDRCPEALRVLDTQDLHCLRRARARGDASPEDSVEGREDLLRELGAIYRSDLTWVLSDFEMEWLTRAGVPAELLRLCRFSYPEPPEYKNPAAEFEDRDGFVFLGNFRHPPNADGVAWLKREVWPEIRARLPGAQVHVYGAYPPREIMELHDPATGFHVEGWAENAAATLARHRVNLAPLRFGAGIKGKISDGWWSGAPCVATPVGAEGMCGDLPFGGLIAETPAALAEAAVRLYSDRATWQEARGRGRAVISELYSERVHDEALLSSVRAVMREREARRRRNLVGRMLRHNLNRSTKYFSKWIEAKNHYKNRASGIPTDTPTLLENNS